MAMLLPLQLLPSYLVLLSVIVLGRLWAPAGAFFALPPALPPVAVAGVALGSLLARPKTIQPKQLDEAVVNLSSMSVLSSRIAAITSVRDSSLACSRCCCSLG